MLAGLDVLRDDVRLQRLLAAYRQCQRDQPQSEWHDRIMEWEGLSPEQLNKLHGLLLANGWIETRVHGDAFKIPGKLESCYRITSEGAALLKLASASHPVLPEDPDDDAMVVV